MSATPDPASVAPRGLPSGMVTFAFTDIEGSTKRWERDSAAMQEAVREFNEATTHDRLTALLRERLAADELTRLLADGAALAPEATVALALGQQ